jgi:hypothetical protein
MSAHQAVFPVAAMARVLGVSEAGFHAWRRRPVSAHAVDDFAVMGQAIEQRGCHLRVAKHTGPIAKGQVGRDDDRSALIQPAD